MCGRTDTLQRPALPAHIGPYRSTGQHMDKGRHRFQPLKPAAPRPPCDEHDPPRPGCPGYQPKTSTS